MHRALGIASRQARGRPTGRPPVVPGRGVEARRVGIDSVNLLEQLPPTSELAYAYDRMSFLDRVNTDLESARPWAEKVTSVAETVGTRTPSNGHPVAASCSRSCPDQAPRLRSTCVAQIKPAAEGRPTRLRSTRRARVRADSSRRVHTVARIHQEGVTLSRECGHELSHVYLVSHRGRLELNRGQREAAAEFAESCSASASSRPSRVALRWSRSHSCELDAATRTSGRCSMRRATFGVHRRALANWPGRRRARRAGLAVGSKR